GPHARRAMSRTAGHARRTGSEADECREAKAAALHWMEMNIIDATGRLARQTRSVVVGDVIGPAVEDIEHIESQPQPLGELVSRLRVEQRSRFRFDAIVLDQRPRPEIASEKARGPRSQIAHRDTARSGGL